MKKGLLILFVSLFVIGGLSAQQRQRSTPEERAKRQTETLVERLSLTKEQKEKVYDIYLKSAQAAAKLDNSDREKMREAMQKSQKERDTEIKAILTEDQQKKYDEVQKEMQERMRNRQR